MSSNPLALFFLRLIFGFLLTTMRIYKFYILNLIT